MPLRVKNAGATFQRLINKVFSEQIGKNVEASMDNIVVKSKRSDQYVKDLNIKFNLEKCVFGVSIRKFLGFMVSQRRTEANPKKIRAILNMQHSRIVKKVQRPTSQVTTLNHFMFRSVDKFLPFFYAIRQIKNF